LLNARIPAMRNQALIGISLFLIGLWLAWEVGRKIVANDVRTLEFAVIGIAACAVAVTIQRNWRVGFYFFLVWMMFEDLVRKYMGNSFELFFGKDVLLALVYVSLYLAIRRRREKAFRPPFLFFLSLFFWLGVLQVFNQNSPSILYGLLGLKVYFYYFPLVFVGYALIRGDEDLRKLLVVNLALAAVISALGIAQAILGNSFLNPAHLDPNLQDLGDLSKATQGGQIFSLPDSVFVSSGRFGEYLIVAFILAMATAAYLLLYTTHSRKLAFVAIALVGAATLLSGSRTAVTYVLASALVLTVGFLWGAPWRWRQAHRLIRAIRRSFIVAALGLAAILLLFPNESGTRLTFYSETLLPSSSAYDLGNRAWDYPIYNLEGAFDRPHWVVGNGIGTASLGSQYVAKALGQRPLALSVEEGFGELIVEMGIVAPFLWLLWTGALLYSSWKIVRRLRGTRLSPIAVGIFWWAFLLLVPLTYITLAAYENYITNAYMWLLLGVLFRLPDLLASEQSPPVVPLRHRPIHPISTLRSR
jgi:hypothetical protein